MYFEWQASFAWRLCDRARCCNVLLLAALLQPAPGFAAEVNDCASSPAIEAARRALIDGETETAIAGLEQLLATHQQGEPLGCQPLALELLGVAFDRAGRSERAVATWQQHQVSYPRHATAVTVQQRLAAARAQDEPAPQEPLADRVASRLQIDTLFTQDYWALSSSWSERTRGRASVVSVVDTQASYQGDNYTVEADVALGYQHALEGPADAMNNDLLAYQAAIGVRPVDDRWGLRIGRQTSYRDGISGRFSGMKADVLIADRWRFNVTAGLPVDTPRYAADSNRRFFAASVEAPGFFDGFDVSAYTHLSQIDGLLDRKAVGTQFGLRYGWSQWFGAVEYDLSYGVLNNASLQANFLWSQRLQAWVRSRAYAWPRLATRNALIGQNFSGVDALLSTYNEGQVRTLARNRTGNALEFGGGFRWTFSQRWSLQSDASYLAIDGSITSGGVAASGNLRAIDASASLHGAGLSRPGGQLIAMLRWSSSRQSDRAELSLEHRLPLGKRLRVAPRLRLLQQFSGSIDGDTTVLTPGLSATLFLGRRSQIEIVADHGWVREALGDLEGGELFSESERRREFYFNARWELAL